MAAALVLFMCPGLYNTLVAMGSMGGAGVNSQKRADESTTAIYVTFTLVAFFGGPLSNTWGPSVCLRIQTAQSKFKVA